MRLIDAVAFSEQCGNYYAEQGPVDGFIGTVGDLISRQPTIEPEVRHGEWHECWYTDTVCASICTNCGKAATQARHIVGQELMTNVRYPLCPNCGARMDGGANDNAPDQTT